MKKWMHLLVAVLCLACLSGCAGSRDAAPDQTAQTVTYQVFGMDCPGCHGGLEKNLLKIPEVVLAQANWKAQIVTIGLKAGADVPEAAIEAAVVNSNFSIGKRVD
jgi:hypothetical protein